MIVGDPPADGHFEHSVAITEGEIVGIERGGKVRRVWASEPNNDFISQIPQFELTAQHHGDSLVVSDGAQVFSVGREVSSGRFVSISGQTFELAWGESPQTLIENIRSLRRLT
jgi:myo-inositol-hexaphosphate 3-phosphohydrolase